MKYSSDYLPLEERQRLDQMWANIAGGPNRNIYANENRGLNSMFRPRDIGQPITQPAMVGAAVMGYHRRPKAGGGYEYHTTGSSTDPLPSGGGWESSRQEWPGNQHLPPQRPSFEDIPERPTEPFPGITQGPKNLEWNRRHRLYLQEPLPQPPVMPTPSPPTTMPTPFPPKTGGPFGGGGKGGNFLGRFERLLDGLEGLVGKLGGSGSTPESPFPTGDGGGLAEVIKTPFTPTQDY
jgi:hypothetical protein